jgi:hypothetical protein
VRMCDTNDTNRQSVDEDERGAAPEMGSPR